MSRLADLGPEFDDFVREASSGLLRVSFLLTGDRGQAEDLLQVSLVRTATHWATARANPTIYTRRVLLNLAKNRWRDLARRPKVARDLVGVEPALPPADEQVVQRDAIYQLVARLPLGQRKVLVLRYFEGLSVAEVAEILGCGEGTVKSRSNRALATLREHLAGEATDTLEERKYVQR